MHWEPRPIALAPSPVPADLYKSLAESEVARTLDRTGMPTILNDRSCCYSGSAVVNDGVPTIVYTRYIHGLPDEPVMRGRAQCIATSDDAMLTWTKRPDPVIAAPPAELVPRALRDQPTRWMVRGRSDDHLKPGHLTAWHDPHVWRGDDGWYLALGSGFMGVGGALLLYRSDDLLDWEYLHPLCAGAEPEFNRWLVPDFFPLDGRHVLLRGGHHARARQQEDLPDRPLPGPAVPDRARGFHGRRYRCTRPLLLRPHADRAGRPPHPVRRRQRATPLSREPRSDGPASYRCLGS